MKDRCQSSAQDSNLIFNKPSTDAYDPNGPKAPGKPGEAEGFKDPKGGENWVPNPNGQGWGWKDDKGNVWIPTGPGPGGRAQAVRIGMFRRRVAATETSDQGDDERIDHVVAHT